MASSAGLARRGTNRIGVVLEIMAIISASGCASRLASLDPIEVGTRDGLTVRAFDADGDGRADYWQHQQPAGRTFALAYADDSGQPGPLIGLDSIQPADCPHFLIVLDGVPFEIVQELYQAGHFRLFHPPTRVICCYPGMTDLALAEMFHAGPCVGYQARHFDRQANRRVEGNMVYLSGRAAPWVRQMDYRCSFWWDMMVYLDPRSVFNHELRRFTKTFAAVDAGQAKVYSVGTAGLGTRGGRAAIEKYLLEIDRLCERIVHDRRGRVKITLTADHGHNLVENRRIKFDEVLSAGGYRSAKSLRGPRDVVTISYGLVTYAEFHTHDAAGVAACLLGHEDVEFVCYRSGDEAIVADRAGQARISKAAGGFVYSAEAGDPLSLGTTIDGLRRAGQVGAHGEIDEQVFFDATVEHEYPDAPRRIWDALHGLVENPPDVVANLRDGACHGSGFFHAMIGKVTSTHGSLNRMNSTTFALTMLGPLPAALRSGELMHQLDEPR